VRRSHAAWARGCHRYRLSPEANATRGRGKLPQIFDEILPPKRPREWEQILDGRDGFGVAASSTNIPTTGRYRVTESVVPFEAAPLLTSTRTDRDDGSQKVPHRGIRQESASTAMRSARKAGYERSVDPAAIRAQARWT